MQPHCLAVLSESTYAYAQSSDLMVSLVRFTSSPVGTPPKPSGLPSPKAASSMVSLVLRYQGVLQPSANTDMQPVVLDLPNTLSTGGYKAKCVRDSQCSGPANWSPRVAGTCSNGRCVCPLPWTGHSCHRQLQCHLYAGTLGWDSDACAFDPALSAHSGSFGCR